MAAQCRVGDQLMFPFLRTCTNGHLEPWGGRSPRDLTRGANLVIFETRGGKSVSGDALDESQLELPMKEKVRGPLYEGAAPLLPLPEMDDG